MYLVLVAEDRACSQKVAKKCIKAKGVLSFVQPYGAGRPCRIRTSSGSKRGWGHQLKHIDIAVFICYYLLRGEGYGDNSKAHNYFPDRRAA